MKKLFKDLTRRQILKNGLSKYAIFLPATSNFYAAFISKQRHMEYVKKERIPASLIDDLESLNFMDPVKGLFYYKWCLYSAGHSNLDLNKFDPKETLFRSRDRTSGDSFVVGDSGGYQIGKGRWAADWKNPNCPEASLKRQQVLEWLDALMDIGMILDIPAWLTRSPSGQLATGIKTYQDAVNGTYINNDYFVRNRNGNCKLLNVLQGETHAEAADWYDRMKDYCDPRIHGSNAFNGWGMGGQLMCSPTLALKTIVKMREDQLLEHGQHDWMHFLGTSKLEWALFLTDIQNAIRKYQNPNFTISFDCASPYLSSANGQIYVDHSFRNRKKWSYHMYPGIDDKKYATDTRLFKDVAVQDGFYKKFFSSPIIDQLKINDICIYAPGDLNKIGKEGNTSWDSFSYILQMGHNTYAHIIAVQEANKLYEKKKACPFMLVDERHELLYASDLIDEIFSLDTGPALALIDKYDRFLTGIIGTRGSTGKKETNAKTYFSKLFEIADNDEPTEAQLAVDAMLANELADQPEDLELCLETGEQFIDESEVMLQSEDEVNFISETGEAICNEISQSIQLSTN